MPNKEPLLQVSRISKTLGKRPVLDHVSFEVYPEEILGFLGPNGAGKSTTLRVICGLVKADEGRVYHRGKELEFTKAEALEGVGCSIETPALYPFLSGQEHIDQISDMMREKIRRSQAFAGGERSSPLSTERKNELIRRVGMEHRIHDKVSTYSLGMKQRLMLALALLGEPRLLVLDEPTNGLDPAGIRELRDLLRHLAYQEGIGVLISSHLLQEAQLICDRVVIIRQGRITASRRIDELQEKSGENKLSLEELFLEETRGDEIV